MITGASGFVGRQLLPRLTRDGHSVVSAGRGSPADNTTVTYDVLAEKAAGGDRLVHLAVLNNDRQATEADFFEINAGLAKGVAIHAANARIPIFVNFSSFHALPDGPDTVYARSKRAGIEALKKVQGIRIVNLFLPAVYGDAYTGKLALVDRVPRFSRPLVFKLLSTLAPTVHIDQIAEFITKDLTALPSDEPVFLADNKDENWVYVFGRKLIDYGFAFAVLLVFWWLLAIVWMLVKTGSDGPGIFAQDRIGKGGKVFTCYKFRTMGKDTRQAGTHEISERAVTSIGAFLRKTKIDELPQIWNILKGELSLLGPRPCLPVQKALIAERERRCVLDVLPGITGLAQIQGIDMSDPVRLARKDAEYAARRGLLLDSKIILATFLGKGQGDRTAK